MYYKARGHVWGLWCYDLSLHLYTGQDVYLWSVVIYWRIYLDSFQVVKFGHLIIVGVVSLRHFKLIAVGTNLRKWFKWPLLYCVLLALVKFLSWWWILEVIVFMWWINMCWIEDFKLKWKILCRLIKFNNW